MRDSLRMIVFNIYDLIKLEIKCEQHTVSSRKL